MGLFGVIAIGIGGMVGGGIFAVLGVAATRAGDATPLAFLEGGVVAALTAYSYARLSVSPPSAGGTVAFVDHIFGINDLTGSLNVVLWAGYIVTTALYASAFGHYTATLFPGGTNPSHLLLRALILLGVLAPWLVNLANAKLVAGSEGIVVALELAILGIVIAAGLPSVRVSPFTPSDWPPPTAVLAAGMLIFVAYEGFELIANASEDARDPARTVPRALGWSVGIVIALYVVIAVVVVGSLTPPEIARSADFALARAASDSLGSAGFVLVAAAAMMATLSAINSILYGAARLSFTIAREGELPERLEHLRWREPVGLHITAGAGLAIAIALAVASISAVASTVFLIVFAVVNAAAFRSSVETGANRILAALGVAGCLGSLIVLLVESVANDPVAVVVLAALLIAVLATEHLYLKRRPARPGGRCLADVPSTGRRPSSTAPIRDQPLGPASTTDWSTPSE